MSRRSFPVVLCVVVFLIATIPAFANKPINRPERLVVGEGEAERVVPDLDDAFQVDDVRIWQHGIVRQHATFLKPHFVNVNLRAGDELILSSGTGHVVEVITGRGPKNRGTFWGLSAMGDVMFLEFRFNREYDRAPFEIDLVIVGVASLFGEGAPGPESICPPEDFDDAICFDDDPGKWANVMASAGVMTVGGTPGAPYPNGLMCSASNVSPNNYVLTNDHCMETQAECDSSEFAFRYYRTGCNDGSPPTADWQSFRCDDIVASSPFISCEATLTSLDFALNSVIGDPAGTFGWVTPDPVAITDGEDIYIIQHPDGRPHEITHGGGSNVDADGHNLRYYDTLDTEGGSSGSPIYRDADDKLIGLHHCGGCTTAGTGNRGMLMADIYPLIEQYLCSSTLELSSAGYQDLQEEDGDGDAVVEPGESWSLVPKVRNGACDGEALDVSADVTVGEPPVAPVTLRGTPASFGTVSAGTTVGSVSPVGFSLPESFVCGEKVVLDLAEITASNGGPWPGQEGFVDIQTGERFLEPIMYEDFSGGIPADWTVVDGGSGGGAAATWTTANPGGRSLPLTSPFAIVDSDEAGFGATQDEELISAPIDCTGSQGVNLQFSYDFRRNASEQCDVDIMSAGTGGAWVNVANFSGGDTSGTVVVDVTEHAAGNDDVQIRFHYYNASYEWWWAVDDIYLLGDNGWECNTSGLFEDGFESGDTSAWSTTVP